MSLLLINIHTNTHRVNHTYAYLHSYSILAPSHTCIHTSYISFGLISYHLPSHRTHSLSTRYVLYGAASLRTGALAAGGSGEKVSVGCMIKIEMNVQANAMRLTVR